MTMNIPHQSRVGPISSILALPSAIISRRSQPFPPTFGHSQSPSASPLLTSQHHNSQMVLALLRQVSLPLLNHPRPRTSPHPPTHSTTIGEEGRKGSVVLQRFPAVQWMLVCDLISIIVEVNYEYDLILGSVICDWNDENVLAG